MSNAIFCKFLIEATYFRVLAKSPVCKNDILAVVQIVAKALQLILLTIPVKLSPHNLRSGPL